jgi:hypothetical protein
MCVFYYTIDTNTIIVYLCLQKKNYILLLQTCWIEYIRIFFKMSNIHKFQIQIHFVSNYIYSHNFIFVFLKFLMQLYLVTLALGLWLNPRQNKEEID